MPVIVSCSVTHRPEQEFNIAVAAFDRGGDNPENAPADQPEKIGNVIADGGVGSRLTHDALLAAAAANFELRLDQYDEAGRGLSKGKRGRQHQFEGDKTDVDGDEVSRVAEPGRRKFADICFLHLDNIRPCAQRLVQLAAAYIDRIDKLCAALQQHLRKATGRSAHIQTNSLLRIKMKVVKRGRELDAAT